MKKLLLSVALLGFSTISMAADLSESCKTYFDKVDSLVKAIPEDSLTKQQSDMMKQNLETGKQQVSSMPADAQEEACKQGIELLKQVEASLPKK
ncbi:MULTISPECIES: DUF5339 domain-containing protein [unclassified Gilliamella]|uniref:DUF5339 domain-containing protein n=1 Tax=unclassified Gilliamella TaxID=2685620 RepID=UPI001307A233|nr:MULTISPECIES: DUF5339 domain-containing protein [unclassified Gilliamella]MWP49998.1 TonB-dependent receptor [Gilliamella sp. Lep-s35]MWP69711.1 TonB-dependent receptor [Gilliamella sp. Lep-s5]MWP78022.1 TonB-dependent receptor [Gilliamella sp. Lep-s21]